MTTPQEPSNSQEPSSGFAGSQIMMALPDRVIEVRDASMGAAELQQVAINLLLATFLQAQFKKPEGETENEANAAPGGYA